jgi:hypothetical protein
MRFFLRTGFGKSSESYGGSKKDCTLRLGQGNAAAGPSFLALSSLIVNSYLQKGHGAHLVSSYTQCLLFLAAVIHVDNTNLPHMTALFTAILSNLIMNSQKLTNAWGGLAIAKGAALKPKKCYAYFIIYHFTNGQASLGEIDDLSTPSCLIPQIEGPPLPSHLNILLPGHSLAPKPTLSTFTASLMLGIWFGSSSCGAKHTLEMCCKGHTWANKLHARPLSHSETWTSFTLQLYPRMSWGLSTVILLSHKLYEATQQVYYKSLPLWAYNDTSSYLGGCYLRLIKELACLILP